MRKYISIIFSFLFALFLVVGCSCKDNPGDEKASLSIGNVNATSYVELASAAELQAKVDNKDSFVLYVFQSGCDGCKLFKPIIEHVIDERNLIIYAIQWNKVKNFKGLESVSGTPSLAVYNKGEVLTITDPDKNNSYFSTYDGFKTFLDEYTYIPRAYYITLSQLREKKTNQDNFIVYFSRKSCGDCSYLNNHYLKDYLNNYHGEKAFYILETDAVGVRFDENGEYDAVQWQAVKDEFGLSEAGSATYGYKTGVVPTFQYYNNGVLSGMMVYANDDGDFVVESDGSYTFTITSSYYDDNPHIGQTITNYMKNYHDTVAEFYNGKVASFLEQNLPFVD